MHYVIEKATGAVVAADTEVQAEMLCLQGHRPLTADERAELERAELDTATAAPANTEIDHVPADDDTSSSAAAPPPKTGAGSGRGPWAEHALAHGVEVAESASRDEIIAAVEAAGAPTE